MYWCDRYDVDNMILAAIWCGRTKPQMAIFLNAFVEEVKQLSVEGARLLDVDVFVTFGDVQLHMHMKE